MTGSISDLASALSSHVGPRVGAHVFEVEFVQYEGPGGTGFEFLNKQLVQSPEGEASCAEVEIVQLLREAHWEAGWFQEFAPKLVTSAWRPALVERVNLPANIQQRHDRVRARMGRQGGCWDVVDVGM